MDGQVIETDHVLQLHVDETYLILVLYSEEPFSSRFQRTVVIRYAETFEYVRIVSIITDCIITMGFYSSAYFNGLFVTEFVVRESNALPIK